MTNEFDYVVVGAGGLGSGAAYWLSRRAGASVLCLEQHELGHALGASEDHSRIIRHGYHAARYTALTRPMYEAWDEVEAQAGEQLVHRIGALNVAQRGGPGAPVVEDYTRALTEAGIPFERLDAAEVMERWPMFRLPEDHVALHQAEGGILDIRRAVAAHLRLAREGGATVLEGAGVHAIRSHESGVELETAAGTFRAGQVVLCAGAWAPGLLAQLGLRWPIRLSREQVTYFATPEPERFAPDRMPIWIWHAEDDFYGFPVYGENGTKAARENLTGPPARVEDFDRDPDEQQVADVAAFCERILPGSTGPAIDTRCCLYDMPPDRDFVIDRLPGHERIAVAIGAGHAAKFASLIGRILSELTLDGASSLPIDAFRADRPALTDPGFAGDYRLGSTSAPAFAR